MTIIRWRGDAAPTAPSQTITVGGTVTNGQVFSITQNGKSVSYTANVGTDTATSVAVSLQQLLIASSIPENQAVTWGTPAAGVFAATTATPGVPPPPITVNATGSGGTIAISSLSGLTGPNDADNAANYSTGSLPVNGDTLYITGSVGSLLYNLSSLSGVTLAALYIDASFVGQIGLPAWNAAGYFEVLPLYFQIGATLCYVGKGVGTGSQLIKLNFGSVQTTIYGECTAQPSEAGSQAFTFLGSNSSNAAYLRKGSYGSALFAGETATCALDVGYTSNVAGDVTFVGGSGLTWGTLIQTGGKTVLNKGAGTATQKAGILTFTPLASGALTLTQAPAPSQNPVCNYNGSGSFTVTIGKGGTFDLSVGQLGVTATAVTLFAGATFNDPNKRGGSTYSGNIVCSGCSVQDVNLNLWSGVTLSAA